MKKLHYSLLLIGLALLSLSCAQKEHAEEALAGEEVVLSLCPGGELTVSDEALSKAGLPDGTLYAVSVYYSDQKYAHGVFDDPSAMLLRLSTGKEYNIQVKAVKDGVNEIAHEGQSYEGTGVLDNTFHYYATDTADEAYYAATSDITSLENQWLLDTYYGALNVTPTSQTSSLTINLYRMMHAVNIRVVGFEPTDGTVTFTQESYLPGTASVSLDYAHPEYLQMAVIDTDFSAVLSAIEGGSGYSRTSVFSADYASTVFGEPYSKKLIDAQSVTFLRNRKNILTLSLTHNYLSVDVTFTFIVENGDMAAENETLFDGVVDTDQVAPVVPEAIDLGLSVKWASFNLGASTPEEYGDYYAWGEVDTYYGSQNPLTWRDGKSNGYIWVSYKWCNGEYNRLTKYCPTGKTDYWDITGEPDNKAVLDPEDDVARVALGGTWRMPTREEWMELQEHCTWNWTDEGCTITGANDNSIFLPAAGYRGGTSLSEEGTNGYYWGATLDTDCPDLAWYIYFDSTDVNSSYYSRYFGVSVRPVTE